MPKISFQHARDLGIPRTSIQTIEIPLAYPLDQSIQWLKHHGFEHKNMRATKNFRRFRQLPDIAGARYFTKQLADGIDLVFQTYQP